MLSEDKNQRFAFSHARLNNHEVIRNRLLVSTTEAKNTIGNTSLILAVQSGRYDFVKLFLESGTDTGI